MYGTYKLTYIEVFHVHPAGTSMDSDKNEKNQKILILFLTVMFLRTSVILYTRGCGIEEGVCLGCVHPEVSTQGEVCLPVRGGGSGQTPPPTRWLLLWLVYILLECILVIMAVYENLKHIRETIKQLSKIILQKNIIK